MGLLDALGKAAPGGNLAKPLMIALGALLVGKMMSGGSATQDGGSATQDTAPSLAPEAGSGVSAPDGGLLGGLGGLIDKLQKAGQGDTVNSWVGSGQNKPIDPGQLGAAIGQKNLSQAAQQAGINEQQLLSQLAQNLPQIVDKLTANGRLPTLQEVAGALGQALNQPQK